MSAGQCKQKRSEGFWRSERRLLFVVPSPPPPENFVNEQNLQNRFKLFTKFDVYLKKIELSVGQYFVVGHHLGPKFLYLRETIGCFCQCLGAKM